MAIPKKKKDSKDNGVLRKRIDPQTGTPYVEIPRQTNFTGSGHSDLHLNDIDTKNLNAGATKYLPGRLRQSPSKEEIAELRAQRKRLQMEQEREYAKESQKIDDTQQKKDDEVRQKVSKKLTWGKRKK